MNQDETVAPNNSIKPSEPSDDREIAGKVAAILTENLKEALKSIDLSIALAFTCVVFLLMHGLQEDFGREISAERSRAAQIKSAVEGGQDNQTPYEGQKTTIPIIGFQAKLLTASLMALSLYWVFCFRAALRCRQAKRIAQELILEERRVGHAALLFPSLATAGKGAKIALCIVLGLLGSAAFLIMYLPLQKGWDTRLFSASSMLIPAGFLCWHILHVPAHKR